MNLVSRIPAGVFGRCSNHDPNQPTNQPKDTMKSKINMLVLSVCLGVATAVTGLTGCSGTRTERSTGESIDDTTTTAA